jgi:hypothetical protein
MRPECEVLAQNTGSIEVEICGDLVESHAGLLWLNQKVKQHLGSFHSSALSAAILNQQSSAISEPGLPDRVVDAVSSRAFRACNRLIGKGVTMFCLLGSILLAGCGASVRAGMGYAGSAGTTSVTPVFQASTYGVVGDGKTDNSAALSRAVQAAMTAGGGQVVIGCGEFLVNTPSSSAPGKRSILYFAKASGIQVSGQGSCSHLFTTLPQKSVLEFDHSTNITVSSLKISAVNAPYVETYGLDGGSAIRFTGVSQGTIDSVEIDGAAAGAIYLTAGTSHVTVSNNNIHDTDGSGIWEDDCSGTNNTNCAPSTPPSYNVYSGNTLLNTTLAALAAIDLDDGNAATHAIVEDNTITWTHASLPDNNQVHCIQLNNVSDATAENNNCTGTPWDGIVLTTGDGGSAVNDTIEGNMITSSGLSAIGGAGIVVYNYPTGKGISGFTIEGNTISSSASDGITLSSASGSGGIHDGTVTQNTITKADQQAPGTCFGIHLDGVTNTPVQSNSIDGAGTSIAAGVMLRNSPGTGVSAQNIGNAVKAILGPALKVE